MDLNIIPEDYNLKRCKGEELSKCHICGYYVPDSFINKDGICVDCKCSNENLEKTND